MMKERDSLRAGNTPVVAAETAVRGQFIADSTDSKFKK
jgi:hypothetical protein